MVLPKILSIQNKCIRKFCSVHLTFRACLHLALACIWSDPNISGQLRKSAVHTIHVCHVTPSDPANHFWSDNKEHHLSLMGYLKN